MGENVLQRPFHLTRFRNVNWRSQGEPEDSSRLETLTSMCNVGCWKDPFATEDSAGTCGKPEWDSRHVPDGCTVDQAASYTPSIGEWRSSGWQLIFKCFGKQSKFFYIILITFLHICFEILETDWIKKITYVSEVTHSKCRINEFLLAHSPLCLAHSRATLQLQPLICAPPAGSWRSRGPTHILPALPQSTYSMRPFHWGLRWQSPKGACTEADVFATAQSPARSRGLQTSSVFLPFVLARPLPNTPTIWSTLEKEIGIG